MIIAAFFLKFLLTSGYTVFLVRFERSNHRHRRLKWNIHRGAIQNYHHIHSNSKSTLHQAPHTPCPRTGSPCPKFNMHSHTGN